MYRESNGFVEKLHKIKRGTDPNGTVPQKGDIYLPT
jgi:hypothetical protein